MTNTYFDINTKGHNTQVLSMTVILCKTVANQCLKVQKRKGFHTKIVIG